MLCLMHTVAGEQCGRASVRVDDGRHARNIACECRSRGDVVRPVAHHLDHSARRQHRITRTLSSHGTSTATQSPVASSTC